MLLTLVPVASEFRLWFRRSYEAFAIHLLYRVIHTERHVFKGYEKGREVLMIAYAMSF